MLLEDVSPSGVAAGRKLAGDTAIVNGSGGELAALRNGYAMAQRMVTVAERQHAVGGVTLQMTWGLPGGAAPTAAGSYPLEVRATDSTGKPVGFVPVVQLSEIGIDANRSVGAAAIVNGSRDTADDAARWHAAEQNGWPTLDMSGRLTMDPRFSVGWNPQGADVTDDAGIARFDVSIAGPEWELAFHTQAPTANVDLYAGSGVQGQVTWSGSPQSASTHQVMTPPPTPPPTEPDGEFVVRKMLDASDIQGDRDMSGFVFEVRAGRDASGTAPAGTATSRTAITGPDGRTPPITVTAGEYTIVEVARPSWATGLTDGGPVTFRFDPLAGPGPLEITYRNLVPPVTIATAARDAADGDKYLAPAGHGAIIDTITYTGLVPGARYVARGTLMAKRTRCDEWCLTPFVRTPFVASKAFVPAGATGTLDVRFEIPADTTELRGTTVVAFQRIEVEASGRVVAEHVDPTDLGQTVYVPAPEAPSTTVPPTTVPPTTLPPTTVPPTTGPVTTSPVEPVPAAPPAGTPSKAIGPALPRTGGNGPLALVALALVMMGVGLVMTIRRRSSREHPARDRGNVAAR
jgi:LPXTG-motif cell wall-anchored protein